MVGRSGAVVCAMAAGLNASRWARPYLPMLSPEPMLGLFEPQLSWPRPRRAFRRAGRAVA